MLEGRPRLGVTLPTCCPRGVLARATKSIGDQFGETDEGGHLPLHLEIDTWGSGVGGDRENNLPWSISRGDVAAASGGVASRTCWTHDETGPSGVRTILTGFCDATGKTDGPSELLPLHVANEGLLPRLHETPTLASNNDNEDDNRLMGWTASSMAPPPRSILWTTRMQIRSYTATTATSALIEARLGHDVPMIAMLGDVYAQRGDGKSMGTWRLLTFIIAAAGPLGSTSLSYELLREAPYGRSRLIPQSQGKEKGESDGGLGCSSAYPVVLRQVPRSFSHPASSFRFLEGRGSLHGGAMD